MSTNGFISMGERVITDYPILPGTENIVSPYGSNINTSLGGSVRYTEFTTDHPQMVRVSDFINEVTGHDFHGTTMMIVYWDSVAEGTIVSLLLASFMLSLLCQRIILFFHLTFSIPRAHFKLF